MYPGEEVAAQVNARVFGGLIGALPSDCAAAELEVWLARDRHGEARVARRDLRRTDRRPGPLVVPPSLGEAIEDLRSSYERAQPAWELAQYRVSVCPDGSWERQLEVVFSGGGGEEDEGPAPD